MRRLVAQSFRKNERSSTVYTKLYGMVAERVVWGYPLPTWRTIEELNQTTFALSNSGHYVCESHALTNYRPRIILFYLYVAPRLRTSLGEQAFSYAGPAVYGTHFRLKSVTTLTFRLSETSCKQTSLILRLIIHTSVY